MTLVMAYLAVVLAFLVITEDKVATETGRSLLNTVMRGITFSTVTIILVL